MSLAVHGLTKTFGGEHALSGVDLEVADGEIHALLGPNGSGKSTLIGCLSGRLTPDAGTMTVCGRTATQFTPRSAFAAGTAVIYQHFSLIPPLTVADNIFLGSELKTSGGQVDRARQTSEAHGLLARLGASELDPRAPVESLGVGQKQLVEIAKAMRHRPDVLVLDEPTAALGEREARLLGQQLRRLKKEGPAILYVSHLLSEVFEIADRVTVLRDGERVLTGSIEDLSPREVIAAIAPRGGTGSRPQRSAPAKGETVLELSEFAAPGVGPVDLTVGAGEVVAIFGLLGSGRSELLEGLYGIRGRTSGRVGVEGRPFVPRSARASLERGLALVPAERGRQGIFATMSALDNLLIPYFGKLARLSWRNRPKERRYFAELGRRLRLKPANAKAEAWTYSGGNQQKLVVGRWLGEESNAHLLLLDEPTQGIDVGARADLYALVRQFARQAGRAVLFTSSDVEEVPALADRVLVLVRGRIVAELDTDEIAGERLLDLAHGSTVVAERKED